MISSQPQSSQENVARRSAQFKPWRNFSEYIWVAPAFIFVLFFTFYAAAYAIWLSFYDYSLASPVRPFIGTENFQRLFQDAEYWQSLRRSLLFVAIDVPLTVGMGFALALLLNQPIRGRWLYRSLLLLPWVISLVIAGYMLKWIFAENTGILNYLLSLAGIAQVPWLSSDAGAFATVVIAHAWRVYPFGMVILLAGLQGISKELYEAAMIDGASGRQRLIHITMPLLTPQFLILLILRTLLAFNMVDLIFTMTGGGPGNATSFLSYMMYQRAFSYLDLGYAAAIGVTIFAINIVLALVYFYVLRRNSA
ncbi:MAG: sugar ABC transporter permease [Deinococcota bacterium]